MDEAGGARESTKGQGRPEGWVRRAWRWNLENPDKVEAKVAGFGIWLTMGVAVLLGLVAKRELRNMEESRDEALQGAIALVKQRETLATALRAAVAAKDAELRWVRANALARASMEAVPADPVLAPLLAEVAVAHHAGGLPVGQLRQCLIALGEDPEAVTKADPAALLELGRVRAGRALTPEEREKYRDLLGEPAGAGK